MWAEPSPSGRGIFAHRHTALPLGMHLNTGLEPQQVCTESSYRAAPAAGPHEFKGVQHKAGVAVWNHLHQPLLNLGRGHPLPDHLAGLQYQQSHAGGEIAGVHDIDMAQILRGDAAVLMG